MGSIFDGVFGRGGAAGEVTAEAWLRAALEAEAALARACAAEGLVTAEAVRAVVAACDPAIYDVAELTASAAAGGNPVIPLVAALRAAVGADHAPAVHLGATSQDILDTAIILGARRALAHVLADAAAAADAAAGLAARHRDDPILGRTLQQAALPTTFGLKAAQWGSAIDAATRDLAALDADLPASLGGPVGTLGGWSGRGSAVATAFAAELGLRAPVAPWHADRRPVAALGGGLALLAGTLAKVAGDVVLLAQAEVAEVQEGPAPGRGGSSAMAHKRNPVASVAVRACAARLPALAATLLAAMPGEHERAAGAWHAEWEVLAEALRLCGSAAAWAREALEGLEVDPARMRANLERAASEAGFDPRDVGEAPRLVDALLAAQ